LCLDAVADRLVARGLRIPGLEAEHLDAFLLRPELERLGDALSEGLVVVEMYTSLIGENFLP